MRTISPSQKKAITHLGCATGIGVLLPLAALSCVWASLPEGVFGALLLGRAMVEGKPVSTGSVPSLVFVALVTASLAFTVGYVFHQVCEAVRILRGKTSLAGVLTTARQETAASLHSLLGMKKAHALRRELEEVVPLAPLTPRRRL